MILISILLLILGGFSKAIMDKLSDGKWDFIYYRTTPYKNPKWIKWFDFKINTCNNKYKNNNKEQGEKFLFSTTILVFLTDGWHFFQFLTGNLLIIGSILLIESLPQIFAEWYWNLTFYFIVIKLLYTISFQILYDWKEAINFFKSPIKILVLLLVFAVWGFCLYRYSTNIFILNLFDDISLVVMILGGITAISGFIYGCININK